jgi:hypothetical protein
MSKENIVEKKKFLNRSERNRGVRTSAMILFEGKLPILERPTDMSGDVYKVIRQYQTRLERRLFAGRPNLEIAAVMGNRLKPR